NVNAWGSTLLDFQAARFPPAEGPFHGHGGVGPSHPVDQSKSVRSCPLCKALIVFSKSGNIPAHLFARKFHPREPSDQNPVQLDKGHFGRVDSGAGRMPAGRASRPPLIPPPRGLKKGFGNWIGKIAKAS